MIHSSKGLKITVFNYICVRKIKIRYILKKRMYIIILSFFEQVFLRNRRAKSVREMKYLLENIERRTYR